MAEGFLSTRLGPAGSVSSCGLLSEGRPAVAEVVEAMGDRGIDIGAHRSRRLALGLIDGTDLILALAREHLREIVVLAPEAFGRTFTLKELVRRAGSVGGRRPDTSLADWLAQVGAGRRFQDLLGASDQDDVSDPIGGPFSAYAAAADELDRLCRTLVELMRPGA